MRMPPAKTHQLRVELRTRAIPEIVHAQSHTWLDAPHELTMCMCVLPKPKFVIWSSTSRAFMAPFTYLHSHIMTHRPFVSYFGLQQSFFFFFSASLYSPYLVRHLGPCRHQAKACGEPPLFLL